MSENEITQTPEETPKALRKKRGWFFYAKVFVVFALLMCVSLAIAVYYVFNKLSADGNLEKLVSKTVSEAAKMPVKLAGIDLALTGVSIRDFSIATDTPQMKLDAKVAAVDVVPDIWAAFSGKFVLNSLHISSGTLNLEAASLAALSGDTSASEKKDTSTGLDLSTLELPFKNVSFNNLRASVTDRSAKKTYNAVLNSASFGQSVFSSSLPLSADLELLDMAAIKVDGSLKWPSEFSANIALTGKNIEEIKKFIPEAYRAQTDFIKGASVSTDVVYNLKTSALSLKNTSLKLEPGIAVNGGADIPAFSPLSVKAELSTELDLTFLWKTASAFLSDDVKTISPEGRLKFAGSLSYDKNIPLVSGVLSSSRITVKEASTSAAGTIENLNLTLDKVGMETGTIKLAKLSVKCTGAEVDVSGTVKNASDIGLDVAADGNISLDEFTKYAASLFKLSVQPGQFKGDIGLNAKVSGSVNAPKPVGSLSAKNVYVSLPDKGIELKKLEGSLTADTDSLKLNKLTAELFEAPVTIEGELKNFKNPVVDAVLSMTGANLTLIHDLVRKNVPDMPAEIEFSGKSDLKVTLKGTTELPQINGTAVLHESRFFHPAVLRPLEKIEGPVSFTNKGLSTDGLTAFWGTSKAVVKGSLNDWAKLISNMTYTVEPLDAGDAAGFFLKDTGYVVSGTGKGTGTVTGEIAKIKVSGHASVASGSAIVPVTEKGEVFKFPFNALAADFIYTDSVFSVNSASLTMFRGQIAANAKFNVATEPISFEFDSNLKNIMSEDFVKLNTKYPDLITGGINGSFKGKGNTTGLVSLNGNAALNMPKGTYTSPSLFKTIGDQLGMPQLASGTIDDLNGHYEIANGRISSNDTVGSSKDGKIVFSGSVGLDTTLNGTANVQVKKATCQNSSILKPLIGDKDMLVIPVGIKGTFTSPSVSLSLDSLVKEAAKNKLESKLTGAIDKMLGKKTETATGTAETSAGSDEGEKKNQALKKVENKVKDLGKNLGKSLKNLFK